PSRVRLAPPRAGCAVPALACDATRGHHPAHASNTTRATEPTMSRHDHRRATCTRALLLAAAVSPALAPAPALAQQGAGQGRFQVEEATIAEIHAAFLDGRLTARRLVDLYLERIEALDQRGPALNAIVTVNPNARAVADSLDALLARTGRLSGPLHGIPVIVKDNY